MVISIDDFFFKCNIFFFSPCVCVCVCVCVRARACACACACVCAALVVLLIQVRFSRQELLEKYGYLDCVPPGSKTNTRLHRLLLYRRRHLVTPGHDSLNVKLTSPDKHKPLTDLHSNNEGTDDKVFEKSSSRINTQAADDLTIPSSKESIKTDFDGAKESIVKTSKEERSTVTVWDPFTGCLHHLPICSRDQIEKAIKKFQVG